METKQSMVLGTLRERSLNRFEAERLGDHCLHSTVALLRAKGYAIGSIWETVPTRFKPVQVKRYFLVPGQNPEATRSKPKPNPNPDVTQRIGGA